ncbi:MAG: RNA polymerase factor sigma-54 [Treponema sp.]|jgi:RNA polymerase sigma-54 factor|nr:RNA polymerase factor sigma-54 [Treponema sp.]
MQQRQAMVQAQQLKMNTQLFLSIKLMELSVMDLREKIGEELEKNPALEVLEEPGMVSLDDAASSSPVEEEAYFEATSDSGFTRRGMNGDERQQFLEGAIARPETLQEHLLWQLTLETPDPGVRRIGELLIQNLDDDGFHKEQPEILLKDGDPAKIEEALKLVQSMDPPGTCTSGYKESLRVQVRLLSGAPPLMAEALDHLEQLEKGRFAETAQLLRCDEGDLRMCFNRIQEELTPFPGRRFSRGETRYAVPDLEVRQKDGEFVIILNNEDIPVLGISPFFTKIAGTKGKPGRETRNFARENIREARWFIQSITQRNHTLLRVSRAIVEFQRPFFSRGPKYLAPLTLRDIARELGVHETTVSRTANGKYVQTEWGLYELRYFFSNSITGTGSQGSRYSKEGVKEIIKEIILGEQRRLSDQELAGVLARRGIPLARRTVAKYRNELDLGSSYSR